MKKRVVSLILVLCMAVSLLPVSALADKGGDDVAYPVDGGNIWFDKATGTVTDCDTTVTSANIPRFIEGTTVIRIGDGAFEDCDSLISVVIPNSITIIGIGAFWDCDSLTDVAIPSSVTSIGYNAFCNCDNLTSVVIPNSVTSIGSCAFENCKSLTGVEIPNSVTFIEYGTFTSCDSLASVIIPNSVTSIGDCAFWHCDSLTDVVIPNSVTSIGKKAFLCCKNLTNVVIPSKVSYIGEEAFSFCDSLTSVLIPGSITGIEYRSFGNCGRLTSAVIHNGVTSIGSFAFSSCDSLASVVIPNSVTDIGEAAFNWCDNLKDVYYSGSKEQWENIDIGSINSALKNATIHYNSPILEDSTTAEDEDSLSKEIILRAQLLSADHTFKYFRTTKSVVQIMANELDPIPSQAWYAIENYIDMYLEAIMQGKIYVRDAFEVTEVEFYEYLLFKLLDNKELNYMSLTKPFSLVDDITGGTISGSLLEKLTKAGFKAGTKITDENMKDLKDVCIAYCGTDGVDDIGILDTFLVTGKTVDEFLSEYTKYYELYTVSDAREEAIRLIGEASMIPELRTAAENVCKSIERVKTLGVSYCLGEGAVAAGTDLDAWLMGKLIDTMCELHPVSKVWKATVDYTTFTMDTIFQTDDISTDTIYIIGMTNVENTLLNAIQRAEDAFLADNSLENAQRYIALADTLQRDLIVGCDLATSLVDHTERGDLNWHGLLEVLKMAAGKKADFGAALKWMFGDENSDFSHMRKTIDHIKTNIKIADFYTGTVSALDLLQNPDSVTPSPWAQEEVNNAISYGILPEWVRTNYQSNITRLEFCALLEFMIEQKTGKTVLQLADELESVEGGQIKPPFDDALYTEANDIARLGIINGVGDNKFNPLGEITRQEAAVMLYRTALALDYDVKLGESTYEGVASWAKDGVNFVMANGIMNGTENGFEPNGKYTKEQAILTIVRFYENLSYEEKPRINYYELLTYNASSWEEAEWYCASLGGHLATLTSQEENDYVYRIVQDAGYKSAYFGLTDKDVEGTWIWVTGESVAYTNWHSGEPNRENSNEDYAMFYYKYSDGTWNDGDFGGRTVNGGTAFICEWDTQEAYHAYLWNL